jgi:hypothetical protein
MLRRSIGSVWILLVCSCGDVQPGCPKGAPDIGDFGATQVPFDQYCAGRECPSYSAAIEQKAPDGPNGCAVTRISGCAFETIVRDYGTYGSEWTYAADSHRLVFAGSYDDVKKGLAGCSDFGFSAGVARPLCVKEKSEPWCTGAPGKGTRDAAVNDDDAGD